jgi:hypothetical protein
MIKLEFNGLPFNPKTFQDQVMKQVMEIAAEQIHQKISSIRHPETGEFPTVVVSANSLDDMKVRVEGSPELLVLVNQRLGILENEAQAEMQDTNPTPKVFLSYTWDDADLAGKIAHTLMANGIDTWWDKWCISAGDSFRQKIDEGLEGCTHFLVLLTPNSLGKPWVNQEMDAGLMRKLQAKSKFIPVRHQVTPTQLPPLLTGMSAPEVVDPDTDIKQLINDIYGITRKPPLGQPPAAVAAMKTGYSAAANSVARFFVERTSTAQKCDPQTSFDELMEATQLTRDDVVDAVHELSGMVQSLHDEIVFPEDELFSNFDQYWKDWNPSNDALKLASDMVNDPDFPAEPSKIGALYGWLPRRLNPAIAYLENRKLIHSLRAMDGEGWIALDISKTEATRRFVKSRS